MIEGFQISSAIIEKRQKALDDKKIQDELRKEAMAENRKNNINTKVKKIKTKSRDNRTAFEKRSSFDVIPGLFDIDQQICMSKDNELTLRVYQAGEDELFDLVMDTRNFYKKGATKKGIIVPLFEKDVDVNEDKFSEFIEFIDNVIEVRNQLIEYNELEDND